MRHEHVPVCLTHSNDWRNIAITLIDPSRYFGRPGYKQLRAFTHRVTETDKHLVHGSQILIEPIECFFDQFVAWDVMSSFVNQMFLLVFRRT